MGLADLAGGDSFMRGMLRGVISDGFYVEDILD